jgi:putative ABC transport system permease protein
METLLHEFRYSLRVLIKSPGFLVISVLTLGLGIGASTSIFSVVYAVLLRELPYPDSQRIVSVWEEAPNGHRMNVADPNFNDFRSQNHTLSVLAKYNYGSLSVVGGSEPVRITGSVVSQDFFKTLGEAPFLGRLFLPEELHLNGARATVVSFGYWQRYLGGSQDLSKFHLTINGSVYSVVGVMSRGFDFPNGTGLWIASEINQEIPSRTAHNWNCLGRVRDGETVERARTDLNVIARRIRAEYGEKVDLTNASVIPLSEAIVRNVRVAILTLLCAVILLFLIACTNVAGLLVARTLARRREMAVRAALGASRGRIIVQFLSDSFVLSFAGGALGILIALLGVKGLSAVLPVNLPSQQNIGVNGAVLLFAVATTVLVALSLGLFAAWRSGGRNVQEVLGSGSRNFSGARSSQRLRGFLVIGQIALTFVILVGSGLLAHSFLRLVSTSPGFRQENLITIEFSPSLPQDISIQQWGIARQIHLMDNLMSRLRAIPGIESVGLTGAFPVARGDNLADGQFLLLNGHKPPTNFGEWTTFALNPSQVGHAYYCVAGDGYFRAMGIPLIRGRFFGDQDDLNSPNVAVISQALARRRWPNQNPIGQLIDFGNMDGNLKPLTIIGIAGDVRARGLEFPPIPIIYVDYRQRGMNANSSPTFVMRGAASGEEIIPLARGIFRELAPDVPAKFSTFGDEMNIWLADRHFILLMVGLFAAAYLVLAGVGIYGVVAFSVTRRTPEIGIRMALGAQRGNILRLVLGESARMVALGVIVGIGTSLAIARLMSSLLFETETTDPFTFLGAIMVLAFVTFLASHIPAYHATLLDPNTALRKE